MHTQYWPTGKLNTPEGKGIVSKFASLFNGKISEKAKKQDERIEKARKQLARWMHKGESEIKIKTYADTQPEDIIRDWNQFMPVDIKRAAYDALKDTPKKSTINYDDLKLKFSSVDLQDNKMQFVTGVLDIPGRGGQGHQKLWLEAEQLIKVEPEAYLNARRANTIAKNNLKAGEGAETAALKELRLQFKKS